MISASKTTSSHYNLKILRPEATKNIKNLPKTFYEFRPRICYFLPNFGNFLKSHLAADF